MAPRLLAAGQPLEKAQKLSPGKWESGTCKNHRESGGRPPAYRAEVPLTDPLRHLLLSGMHGHVASAVGCTLHKLPSSSPTPTVPTTEPGLLGAIYACSYAISAPVLASSDFNMRAAACARGHAGQAVPKKSLCFG